jgi:hypothetical protein
VFQNISDSGSAANRMPEVISTPKKRQSELGRFQNRLAGYKKHSEECSKKYENTFKAQCEQDASQTKYLRTKFLQNKDKRSVKKKIDHSNNNNTSMVSVNRCYCGILLLILSNGRRGPWCWRRSIRLSNGKKNDNVHPEQDPQNKQ